MSTPPGDARAARDRAALPTVVEVAVPVPILEPLSYSLPEIWRSLAVPGVRARVRIGKRRLTGMVVAAHGTPPPGVTLRPIDEIVDLVPVLPDDLLELARFAHEYYLTPIGDVFSAMVPPDLKPWGAQRVRLNNRGALAPYSEPSERRLIELLMTLGNPTLAELQATLGSELDVGAIARRLAEQGHVSMESPRSSGGRYVTAVELPAGDLEHQLASCGRSAKGREVVELLSALERPATLHEVTAAVGCGDSVIRRLIKMGVLRHFSQPRSITLGHHRLSTEGSDEPFQLRSDQRRAVDSVDKAIEVGAFRSILLAGMTGSGKTEIYLRAITKTLSLGRSAIVLVPEIAMVPSLARDLVDRFGKRVAMLHSGLSRSERHQEWERLRSGEADVVVGPRSAVFAPVERLGLLVIDEEHDPSYKQDSAPRYGGRDLALVRARSSRAVAILVSATPSLETRLNVERERYSQLTLDQRVGHGRLPEGILVDLRKEDFRHRPGEIHFSPRLLEEMKDAIDAGDQIILFRNRRGFAPVLLCRACGEDLRCDDCGLPRTYHRREARLICHYCGSTIPAPKRCKSCGEQALEAIGAGTERVEDEVRRLFPEIGVGVLDRDATQRRGGAAAVLERFGSGKNRILIGTQMVAKGHHFPNVSLAVVLSADTYLGFPDFRAVERTYNLITQLAGRAGRGSKPGRVVIQTHHPEHYAIRAALQHDDQAFAEQEMHFRRVFHYPPYSRAILLLLRDRNRARGAVKIAQHAARLAASPLARGVRVTGPAPAPLERLRGHWRFQLLLRGTSGQQLRQLVRESGTLETRDDLIVDVDPQALL